jgi:hypothetical protein
VPRLVGRGRALKILMSADDCDADLAGRYVSLPPADEFPAQVNEFWTSVARPATQDRTCQLFGLGLQQPGEVERQLGRYLERIVAPEGYTGKT